MDNQIINWHINNYRRLYKLAEAGKLPHALLFAGMSGIGKKEFTLEFSKLLICKQPILQLPCNNCKNCKLYNTGNFLDLTIIKPELGKAILVDQVRSISENIYHRGSQTTWLGNIKIVVIENADTLNINAANFLLKILEEPPQDVYFILVSDSPAKLLATIRSRVQRHIFLRPELKQCLEYIQSIDTENSKDLEAIAHYFARQPLLLDKIVKNNILQSIVKLINTCNQLIAGNSVDLNLVVEALTKTNDNSHIYWQVYFLVIVHNCMQNDIFCDDLYFDLYNVMYEKSYSGIDHKALWFSQFVILRSKYFLQ